jgi:hypothetical protein
VRELDYEIVVSTENTAYFLWQCLLFFNSCVQVQQATPRFVVHENGGLLPGYRALAELGAHVQVARNYRSFGGQEYPPRNSPGSLLEVRHTKSWTMLCDPDFLFLRPLPSRAAALCGQRSLSWESSSFMLVNDGNLPWLSEACSERNIDPRRAREHRQGGSTPSLVHRDLRAEFAQRWLEATGVLVDVGVRRGHLNWISSMWGFALAAWEMNREIALTRVTQGSFAGSETPQSALTTHILHYSYGDQLFDKRNFGNPDTAPTVWSQRAAAGSVSAHMIERLKAARAWYASRGVDVTSRALYRTD